MTGAEFSLFVTSAGLLLFMPGPTNAVMMASGAAFGMRRSLPLAFVALLGYLFALMPLTAFAQMAGDRGEALSVLLKLISSVILIAISMNLWLAATSKARNWGNPKPICVFALTLFNPKALVISFGITPPIVGLADLGSKCAILGALVVLSAASWIFVGTATRTLPEIPTHWIARATSVVLACFAMYFFSTVIAAVDFH
jgi:threonine/homoserine/homoserine lactone efflux protein